MRWNELDRRQIPGRDTPVTEKKLKDLGMPNKAVYAEIVSEYLLEADVEEITKYTYQKKYSISFRPAKSTSLWRLSHGAGAKGHDVLDKSITESGLRDVYGEGADFDTPMKTMFGVNYIEKVGGFVGHEIKEEHRIDGIYLTQCGYEFFSDAGRPATAPYCKVIREADDIKKIPGKYYLEFGTGLNQEAVYGIPGYETYFLTGDYDMHDLLLSIGSSHAPVPSDMEQEKTLIGELNKKLGYTTADFENREAYIKRQYLKVQHGPQLSYIAHMLDKEPSRPVVPSVADQKLPVAMCHQGIWCIIRKREDLVAWYKDHGFHIKKTWEDEEKLKPYLYREMKKEVLNVFRENARSKRGPLSKTDAAKKLPEDLKKKAIDATGQVTEIFKTSLAYLIEDKYICTQGRGENIKYYYAL